MCMQYKSLLIVAFVTIVAAIAAFFYLTRPALAPSPAAAGPSDGVQGIENSPLSVKIPEGASRFRIIPEESLVEFYINEVLNGKENTVIGATNQIFGDIALDMNNPAETKLGALRINARTLATDDSRRDGVISRNILHSDTSENEFIAFTPKTLSGLPGEVEAGDTFAFQITGDLSVAGVTREVVFNANLESISEDRIVGSAETEVLYSDFGLSIPSVPFVASVEKEVILKVRIVATRI